MNLNARITLAIRNFFRKYGRLIVIAFVINIYYKSIFKESPRRNENRKCL